MKLTILWSSLASYSVEFFRQLAIQGCSIQIIFQSIGVDAPYQSFDLSFCEMALEDSDHVKKDMETLVNDFGPNCILMSSWCFHHFMKLTRLFRKKGVYVVSAMDNQWRGTPRQYLGVIISPVYLKGSIDAFLVTGDRQAQFARKLGYKEVMYGYAAAETERFMCDIAICDRPRNFLFVGRLVRSKGIEELAKGYLDYVGRTSEPWGLKVAGTGHLEGQLAGIPGVELLGFVQPRHVPRVMSEARCLILPSLWEPWGVVLHEATSAGLPVIASYECGAATAFARDGGNGFVVSPEPRQLADAMLKISRSSEALLKRMSDASSALAATWTPALLAEYFIKNVTIALTR